MIDSYVNIVDASKLITLIFYFCVGCIIINFIITLIYNIRNKNNPNTNKNETKKNLTIIDYIGAICMICILLLILPIFIKINRLISFIYIPSYIIIFYIIYIRPMTTDKPSAFKFNYYDYGAVVTFLLIFFSRMNYKDLFIDTTSEGSMQVTCILFLLFEIYSSFYCLLLNIYFVIKNMQKINIKKAIEKYEKMISIIYNKFDYNNISLTFSNSNNLIYNPKKRIIKKILLFFPYFILDITICLFKYIFSLFISCIIKPFFIIISFIFSIIMKLSNTNENQINYGLTKIVWTISIIFVYIILQTNEIFQDRIINVYEFISSVIIIPIILEALISLKERIIKNK